MCKNCEGSMFAYKKAHMLHDIPFNAEFVRTTLDYLDSLPDRKDDWRFTEEWSWIVIGSKDYKKYPQEHEGVWGHYLSHADPKRYGEISSVGPDGTVDNPCGEVCEYQRTKGGKS